MVDFGSLIAATANKPTVPLESPFDAQSRALQLQHLAGQNQMTQMDLQQKQLGIQRQQAYTSALQQAAQGGQPAQGQAPQAGQTQQGAPQGGDLGSFLPPSMRQGAAVATQARQTMMAQGMWTQEQEQNYIAQMEKMQQMATSNMDAQQKVKAMAKAEQDQMVSLSQKQGDVASRALTETDPTKRAAILQDGLSRSNDIFAPQPGDSAALTAYKQSR